MTCRQGSDFSAVDRLLNYPDATRATECSNVEFSLRQWSCSGVPYKAAPCSLKALRTQPGRSEQFGRQSVRCVPGATCLLVISDCGCDRNGTC
jgi:hypothetical protein